MNTFDTTFWLFNQILIFKSNQWQCNKLKRRKNAFPPRTFTIWNIFAQCSWSNEIIWDLCLISKLHRWYAKILKHIIFDSIFARWRCIIWYRVFVYKYSDRRNNQLHYWTNPHLKKILMALCSKLIIRRLLIKLAIEWTFKFNNNIFKASRLLYHGWTTVFYFSWYTVKLEKKPLVFIKGL